MEWHLRHRLSPLLYQDEDWVEECWRWDPVIQIVPSPSVRAKKASQMTPEGWPVHSLHALLAELATRCRNTCRIGEEKYPYASVCSENRGMTGLSQTQARSIT